MAGNNDLIEMNIPQVENIAGRLDTAAEVLRVVSRGMQIAAETLEATAFIGLVGGAAIACYLRSVEPKVSTLAEDLSEGAGEVRRAIENFRAQDFSNAGLFG